MSVREPPSEFSFQRLKLGKLLTDGLEMHLQLVTDIRAGLLTLRAEAEDAGNVTEGESNALGRTDELHAFRAVCGVHPVAALFAFMLEKAEVGPVAQGLDPFTGLGGQLSDGERSWLRGHDSSVATSRAQDRGLYRSIRA